MALAIGFQDLASAENRFRRLPLALATLLAAPPLGGLLVLLGGQDKRSGQGTTARKRERHHALGHARHRAQEYPPALGDRQVGDLLPPGLALQGDVPLGPAQGVAAQAQAVDRAGPASCDDAQLDDADRLDVVEHGRAQP